MCKTQSRKRKTRNMQNAKTSAVSPDWFRNQLKTFSGRIATLIFKRILNIKIQKEKNTTKTIGLSINWKPSMAGLRPWFLKYKNKKYENTKRREEKKTEKKTKKDNWFANQLKTFSGRIATLRPRGEPLSRLKRRQVLIEI